MAIIAEFYCMLKNLVNRWSRMPWPSESNPPGIDIHSINYMKYFIITIIFPHSLSVSSALWHSKQKKNISEHMILKCNEGKQQNIQPAKKTRDL